MKFIIFYKVFIELYKVYATVIAIGQYLGEGEEIQAIKAKEVEDARVR